MMDKLIDSWYSLLNGNLSYNSVNVEVFTGDIPETYSGHYVWLRAEGGADDSNKSEFVDQNVVVVDIVTVFKENVNRSVCESIDSQIRALLYVSPYQDNFPGQSGVQFHRPTRETYNYLHEDDGSYVYYRKISRYKTRTAYA